jgi:hypothetical protein
VVFDPNSHNRDNDLRERRRVYRNDRRMSEDDFFAPVGHHYLNMTFRVIHGEESLVKKTNASFAKKMMMPARPIPL